MPTTPADRSAPSDDDAALDHVVKNLFDTELQRIAYARAETEHDRARAAAAVREIARREAEHPVRSGVEASAAPAIAERDRARGAHPRPTAGDDAGRAWWRRPIVLIGAAVAAIMAVTSIVPALTTATVGASSLDVFADAPTDDELDLERRLVREGLRLSVAPRVIAQQDDASILAYRLIVSSGGERARNEVCLLLMLEQHALGSPVCTERSEFLDSGMLASLPSGAETSVVQWGPTGEPRVSVLLQNQVELTIPRSPAADVFLSADPSATDLRYAQQLRALHPDDRLIVRVLATTATWDAVGTIVASASTGRWSHCVHLFEREVTMTDQLGARVACASLEQFERVGLLARSRADDSIVAVEWLPDGTVTIDERTEP